MHQIIAQSSTASAALTTSGVEYTKIIGLLDQVGSSRRHRAENRHRKHHSHDGGDQKFLHLPHLFSPPEYLYIAGFHRQDAEGLKNLSLLSEEWNYGEGIPKMIWTDKRRIVIRELGRRGWELPPDVDQFAEEVLTALDLSTEGEYDEDEDEIKRLIVRGTTRRYSSLLHKAIQTGGLKRQRRAFEELWNYLFPIALYKTHDEERAEEYTQRALIKAWEKSRQCKDPDRFLGWAKVVLLNEIRMEVRKAETKRTITWTDLGEKDREDQWRQEAEQGADEASSSRPSEDMITEEETIQRLREGLKTALRSDAQRTVIEKIFIRGWGFKAIAEVLETSVSNVYTLKSRALANLRQDENFQRLLTELVVEDRDFAD